MNDYCARMDREMALIPTITLMMHSMMMRYYNRRGCYAVARGC